MILDRGRMDAYVRALRQSVKPGSVVVDLGCGPGLFALMAAELGARRVFAIDPSNLIQVARDAAREHGFGDRIEFIQESSTKISLPERADVIVSDLRGVLPWFAHHIGSIVDARTRFLAPGGILIPRCDKAWAAIVEVPEHYERIVKPWNGDTDGLTLSSARNLAVNMWSKFRARPENLLSESLCWYELDYGSLTETNFDVRLELTITRAGTAHGFALWFDAELIDGVGFSNAPGADDLIYGNAFFPFKEPVEVAAGDRIEIRLEARLIGEDYVWRWDTTSSSKQIDFKQSTLFGTPLSLSQLRKRANTYVPTANDEGAIVGFVISQMNGTNSIEQIAAELVKEFRHRFGSANEAFDVVVETSEKYSV
jgi:type I protein arginine methyltransferase